MTVADLIEATHGVAAAQHYQQSLPGEVERDALIAAARDILTVFPPAAGACLLLSASIAVRTASLTSYPAYVAAGSLAVGRVRVFGEDAPWNGRELFSRGNPAWDGHAWVIFGDRIVDASIFRTAYSGRSHPTLATFIREKYGARGGVMITTPIQAEQDGLTYQPQYILSGAQVDGLAAGAFSLLRL